MTKRNCLVKHKIPINLSSLTQKIFVSSFVEYIKGAKEVKTISFYGIDLLSKKVCPNTECLYFILSEIFQRDFTASEIYSAEFIITKPLIKSLSLESFREECLLQKEELLDFWTIISIYESIDYINQLLFKINSKEMSLENAKPVLARLIEHFSTGQIWNLSYKANQRACEIILTKKIAEADYPDVLLQAILEKGLLYINKKWYLLPYKRWGNQCKQSELSKFFFNKILEIGEDGFNKKPSLENLKI